MQTRMFGSRKFAELQAFPLDPQDYAMLKERVAPDSITIYLRLFNDHEFRTVVVVDRPRNFARMWRLFAQQNKSLDDDGVELAMVNRVYEAFAGPASVEAIDVGKVALKMLCMHYRPSLRTLIEAPRDNVVGVIMEFKQQIFKEYCYVQFAVDDVPGLTARFH